MSTNLSGTLVDSTGTVWKNAPIQIILQPPANTPGPYLWSGGAYNPMPPLFYTDNVGYFAITLPSNNEIIPSGSVWQIIIGPTATYPAFVFRLALTTPTYDMSAFFSANAIIKLVPSLFVPRAYNDTEMQGIPNEGQLYFDTSIKQLKIFTSGAWANVSAGGGGMVYPPAGIPVSTGAAWSTSIDPALVPRLNISNTFTASQKVKPTVVNGGGWSVETYNGTVEATFDAVDTAYPKVRLYGVNKTSTTNPAGFQIDGYSSDFSVGATWMEIATNIANPKTIFYTELEATKISATGNAFAGFTSPNQGLTLAWNLSNVSGESDFINARGTGGGGFQWFNVASNTAINSATPFAMKLDSANALTVKGNVTAVNGNLRLADRTGTVAGSPSITTSGTNLVINPGSGGGDAVYLSYDQGGGGFKFGNGAGGLVGLFDGIGNGQILKTFQVGLESGINGNLVLGGLAVTDFASYPSVTSAYGTLHLNAPASGSVSLCMHSGAATIWGNGAGVEKARMDAGGNLNCSGTVTAAGKSFRIPHPVDSTKDLIHTCLEGPEWGVYYRGEATTVAGVVEVTLPPYFEALTYTEDRSVLLTVIVDDAAPVFSGQIAAGRIVAGKFKIYSEAPAVTIAWQVNAIRKFGDSKLVVEPQKAEVIK